jgi:hypothetical protein
VKDTQGNHLIDQTGLSRTSLGVRPCSA